MAWIRLKAVLKDGEFPVSLFFGAGGIVGYFPDPDPESEGSVLISADGSQRKVKESANLLNHMLCGQNFIDAQSKNFRYSEYVANARKVLSAGPVTPYEFCSWQMGLLTYHDTEKHLFYMQAQEDGFIKEEDSNGHFPLVTWIGGDRE